MDDTLRVGGGERDRVAATDQEVAGVDAQAHAGAGEHPLGLLPRLDHGADVGVERRHDAAGAGVVGDPVEVAEQRRPAGVVQLGPGVVPVDPGVGRQHDDAGAAGDAAVDEAVHLGHRVVLRGRAAGPAGSRRPRAARTTRAARPWPRARPPGSRRGRTRWRPAPARASARAPCRPRAGSPSRAPRTRPTRSGHRRSGPGRAGRRRGSGPQAPVVSCVTDEIVVTGQLTCQ